MQQKIVETFEFIKYIIYISIIFPFYSISLASMISGLNEVGCQSTVETLTAADTSYLWIRSILQK